MKQTWVFLDVDDVLSLPDVARGRIEPERWLPGTPCWPVPLSFALVRVLSQDHHFRPYWLTSWGERALEWNRRAGTRPWPIAYHLARRQWGWAGRYYPNLPLDYGRDWKFLSVLYHLRDQPERKVIWIEDGFSPIAHAHSLDLPHMRLVDALRPEVRDYLLEPHCDLDAAARHFMAYCAGTELSLSVSMTPFLVGTQR